VSFAHGSNDGQKGHGLIVLILVGIFLQASHSTCKPAGPVAKIRASRRGPSEQSLQKSGQWNRDPWTMTWTP